MPFQLNRLIVVTVFFGACTSVNPSSPIDAGPQNDALAFDAATTALDGASAATPVQRHGALYVCDKVLCDKNDLVVQLRGMSTHGLQWYGWGDCITEQSLDVLAEDWNADILRVSLYVQEGGYATDPDGFTSQVRTIVDAATERGLYVLIDWHQLDPGNPNANLVLATEFFTAMATQYSEHENVIYDIANEPNGVSWGEIQSYATTLIPTIRSLDPDAIVLVGTHGWSSLGISDGASGQDIVDNPITFENIMYTFHFYAASHGSEYRDELAWAAERLPLFVTEWGTQTASGDGANDFESADAYLALLNQHKISWTSWNYSDDFRTGAAWKDGTCASGDWTAGNLKEAGVWVRERIANR